MTNSEPAVMPSRNEGSSNLVPLSHLLLDAENPRFGGVQDSLSTQKAVLDHIVEVSSIDDVLSSLAVNGYFRAEPLVGRVVGDKTVIVEGNRRLAACLILAGDSRASNQAMRSASAIKLWNDHGRKTIDPLPVITFSGDQSNLELLSYLGVRHISASAPWDSYAKASWAASVVTKSNMTVSDISTMIGDPHRTVARLLEGFFVMRQVISSGHFIPSESVRRGKGSVTEYPFSWVYTILGYTAARRFVGMPETGPAPDPIQEANLPKVRIMLTAMFGNRSIGRNAAIRDSRSLGNLALALLDTRKTALIEQGKMLEEVEEITKPLGIRLETSLEAVRGLQSELVAALSMEQVPEEIALKNLNSASNNRKGASAIERLLREVAFPDSSDDV